MKQTHLISILFSCLVLSCSNTEGIKNAPQKNLKSVQFDSRTSIANLSGEIIELDNGLTVILHQDNSDPIVHTEVLYKVGSSHELANESGYAHLAEHIMFQGTNKVAPKEHNALITKAGGTLNAKTNVDVTRYYQLTPSHYLETVLWLESDRMQHGAASLSEQSLAIEKKNVYNEYLEKYKNYPANLANQTIYKQMYQAGSGYEYAPIGSPESVLAASVGDIQSFIKKWYSPNNAIITIAGDFERNQVISMLNKYFAPIANSTRTAPPKKLKIKHLTENQFTSVITNTKKKFAVLAIPTVAYSDDERILFDLTAQWLNTSLNQQLIDSSLSNSISRINTSHRCRKLACYLRVNLNLKTELTQSQQAQVTDQLIGMIQKSQITDAQFAQLTNANTKAKLNNLESVSQKVSTMSTGYAYTNQPEQITLEIKRLDESSKEDINTIILPFFADKHALFVNNQYGVISDSKKLLAMLDTLNNAPINTEKTELIEHQRPQIPVAPHFDLPNIWQSSFDNGLSVKGIVSNEQPITHILIKLPAGHFKTSSKHAGLAHLTASMLNQSNEFMHKEKISALQNSLGITLKYYVDNQNLNIYLSSLNSHLNQAVELLTNALLAPSFDSKELAEVKKSITAQINSKRMSKPDVIANKAWNSVFFQDTVAQIPQFGTHESLSQLTHTDIKGFFDNHIRPNQAVAYVVSNLSDEKITQTLSPLANWQPSQIAPTPQITPRNTRTDRVYLLDQPNSKLVMLLMGKQIKQRDLTGEYYKTKLTNYSFGEAFNSRVMTTMREQKGLAYGAYSEIIGNQDYGFLKFAAAVDQSNLVASFETMKELAKQYQSTGPNQKEIAFMKESITNRTYRGYESSYQKLMYLALLDEYQGTASTIESQHNVLNTMLPSEFKKLAHNLYDPKELTKIMIGDAQVIKQRLPNTQFTEITIF